MTSMTPENAWGIISSYFKGRHLEQLVRHHLESYNNLIKYDIEKTINMFNPVVIRSPKDYDEGSGKYALEISVQFSNLTIYRQQIYENKPS